MACWSTKVAISLKRVKIDEKLLWRAYRNSPTLLRTVRSRTPYGHLFPKIKGSQPPPKISFAIISGTAVKLRSSNLVGTFTGCIRTKVKLRKKGAWAYPGTAQFLKSRPTPVISVTGKATNFKLCTHILRIDRNSYSCSYSYRNTLFNKKDLFSEESCSIGLSKQVGLQLRSELLTTVVW